MSNFCKEYNLSIGNENYTILLKNEDNGKGKSILIEARNNNSYYQSIYNLSDLMMLSKAFRFCDNINEAINTISKIFESYNKSFIKKGNSEDELILFLKINLPSGEEQKIKLTLYKIETSEKSFSKNQPNSNEENGNNNEEEMGENSIITDIIKTQEEIDFIENRLKEINYFKNKEIKYKLLYKGTKNGDKSLNFHTRVDGVRNTLSLVKTKKGAIFGGFTSQTWNQIGGFGKVDPLAFCFSLDLKKIYNSQSNHIATLCSDGYGPYFKGVNTIFGIYNNFFTEGGWCDYTTAAYSFGKFDKNFEITNGEQKFEVEEVEVFKIYTN